MDPQTVNLALETSLLFQPKDVKNNVELIKNLKNFLDKLYKVISPAANWRANKELTVKNQVTPDNNREHSFRTDTKKVLTDFLIALGMVLVNHTDVHLKNITNTFYKTIDELYYKESLFHEVFIESKLKNYIRNIVKDWNDAEPDVLRTEIRKIIFIDSDPIFRKFFKKLNRYFDFDADEKKVKNIVTKIYKYPKQNKDLSRVMYDGLKYLIFDHYNALNYTSKLKIAGQLQKITNYITDKYSNKIIDPTIGTDFRKSLIYDDIEDLNNDMIDMSDVRLKYSHVAVNSEEIQLAKNIEDIVMGIAENFTDTELD